MVVNGSRLKRKTVGNMLAVQFLWDYDIFLHPNGDIHSNWGWMALCFVGAFRRRSCPKQLTVIHTLMAVAAMQGADQHIRSSLGFSILPKDRNQTGDLLLTRCWLSFYFIQDYFTLFCFSDSNKLMPVI